MKRALYICTLHHRRSKEFNIWSMSLKWNFWQSLTEDLKVIWKLKVNLTMKRFGQRGKVTKCDNEVLKILFHLGEQYQLNCFWSVFFPVIVIWIINKVQYRSIFFLAVQFTLSEAQNTFFNYRHSNHSSKNIVSSWWTISIEQLLKVFSPVIVIWIINKVQCRSIFLAVQFTLSEAQNTFFNYRHSNYYKPKCIYWLCTINRWRRCFNFN